MENNSSCNFTVSGDISVVFSNSGFENIRKQILKFSGDSVFPLSKQSQKFPVSCVGNVNTFVVHLTDINYTFFFYVEDGLNLI